MREKKKALLCAAAVVEAAMLVSAFIIFTGSGTEKRKDSIILNYDQSAIDGELPGKTEEEIQKELNAKVEEGMFNISINPEIRVDGSTDVGNARIENIKANHYLMQVDIKEGEKILYSSGNIRPGQYIDNIKMADMDSGEYDAQAVFTALDTESGEVVGRAGAVVKLYVD